MDFEEATAIAEQHKFKLTLSLDNIIEFWKEEAERDHPVFKRTAQEILAELENASGVTGPIEDPSTLAGHKELLQKILSVVFSYATWNEDRKGIMAPFGDDSFFETPKFREGMEEGRAQFQNMTEEKAREFIHFKIISAYMVIIDMVYGVESNWDWTMTYSMIDPETGFEKYYGINVNPKFVDVRVIGEKPNVTSDDISRLLADLNDIDSWRNLIPPDQFEFYGFVIVDMIDITETQIISSMKQDLLERNALFNNDKFTALEKKFQNLLGSKDIELDIRAFHESRDMVIKFREDELNKVTRDPECDAVEGEKEYIKKKFFEDKHPFVTNNLDAENLDPRLAEYFKLRGINSALYTPLVVDGVVEGVLHLTSKNSTDLTALSLIKIKELLPLLATVVRRSVNALDSMMTRVIKTKFTAIHPTVEWKFEEVAIRYLQDRSLEEEEDPMLEEIVFDKIYPLYGATDIRNSSELRNKAIQADLRQQLEDAKFVMNAVIEKYSFPIYNEIAFEIDEALANLKGELKSQDEVQMLEFLSGEIEPLFKYIATKSDDMKAKVDRYFELIDPKLGLVYNERKAYEESVEMINRNMYKIIEHEEQKAQSMFPFYFENYKTDGVEYNIYIGQSLVQKKEFHDIYLRNLRLWQLIVTCKVALAAEQLKAELPVELSTTQLMLAQSTPLSIRFRADEKKFDVDGSYNIRYEIMKKRIDKATIKGTGERLTQPNQIAIVYANQREKDEYTQYLKYLAHLQLISGDIESHELQDLQGLRGLKALRVKINVDGSDEIEASLQKELSEIIGEFED